MSVGVGNEYRLLTGGEPTEPTNVVGRGRMATVGTGARPLNPFGASARRAPTEEGHSR